MLIIVAPIRMDLIINLKAPSLWIQETLPLSLLQILPFLFNKTQIHSKINHKFLQILLYLIINKVLLNHKILLVWMQISPIIIITTWIEEIILTVHLLQSITQAIPLRGPAIITIFKIKILQAVNLLLIIRLIAILDSITIKIVDLIVIREEIISIRVGLWHLSTIQLISKIVLARIKISCNHQISTPIDKIARILLLLLTKATSIAVLEV